MHGQNHNKFIRNEILEQTHYKINYAQRLFRVIQLPVTYCKCHRFIFWPEYVLLSLRIFKIVLSTKASFFSRMAQLHTVHIRHKVIIVVLLETSLTSTILLRPPKQQKEVHELHSNEEVETAVRERSRAQKSTSDTTAEYSNTWHCETYTSIFGEIALESNVTSVDQSCSTKRCNLV